MFANKRIQSLSLSASIGSRGNPTSSLMQLFRMEGFSHLTEVNISRLPLSLEDISLLRLLPQLSRLDVSFTNATNIHLLHLAIHASTLRELNISGNEQINDDCRVPLTALVNLQALHLRGTIVTVPCLRLLVYALPESCRFITLPLSCLNFFNNLHTRYSTSIPDGYVEDPRRVPNLTLPQLKKNLELHKKANDDILLTGSKVDLVDRLMALLCARVADGRIIRRIGRA